MIIFRIYSFVAALSFCLYSIAAPTNMVVNDNRDRSDLRRGMESLSGTFKEREVEPVSGTFRRDAEPLSDTFKRDAEPLADTFKRDAEPLADTFRRSSLEAIPSLDES